MTILAGIVGSPSPARRHMGNPNQIPPVAHILLWQLLDSSGIIVNAVDNP